MDSKAEEFVDRLLSGEAHEQPSDSVKVEDLEMKLPEWFDEKKYNQGRRFYSDFCFMLSGSMLLGLVAVFSIPSILSILIGTRRSNSVYTSYKRYFSTHVHTSTWFDYELKPGTKAWRSLHTVRSRHIKAGRAATLQGRGTVSQRDVALTLFGFIGFSILKPDKFAITQLQEGDWEAYNHFWKVIGHMIGLQDRYNICRDSFEETREVCQIIMNRVYTPCLENVPEYFDHMTHVMIEGISHVLTAMEPGAAIYGVKWLAEVPGYIYTEQERRTLQNKISKILKGRPNDLGVDSSELIKKCAIDGLPKRKPNMFYLRDFDSVENSPAYKKLSIVAKYKLALNNIIVCLYSTYCGRMFFNFYFKYIIFIGLYLPYVAAFKFGIKDLFLNIFKEDPVDDEKPKPNSEYNKPQPPEPWYKVLYGILW